MNSIASTIAAPSATVSAPATLRVAHLAPDGAAATTCRSVALDTGNLLRILDGSGLRVTPATGVLWITEENSATDTVLLPGETHRIAHRGLTLVLAHRPAIALLEVSAGATPPRRVDLAYADGAPGRRVWFGRPPWFHVRALARAARTWLRNCLGVRRPRLKLRRAAPGGWREHDMVHSTWLVRHARRGLAGHRSLPDRARDAFSRDPFLPYY